MSEGDIVVRKTDYGCVIEDTTVKESVAIDLEDVRQLIRDLQELLPFEFNEVAMPPPPPGVPIFTSGVDYGHVFVQTEVAEPIGKILETRHTGAGIEFDVEFFCNGTKECQGEKHANDCPMWEE